MDSPENAKLMLKCMRRIKPISRHDMFPTGCRTAQPAVRGIVCVCRSLLQRVQAANHPCAADFQSIKHSASHLLELKRLLASGPDSGSQEGAALLHASSMLPRRLPWQTELSHG